LAAAELSVHLRGDPVTLVAKGADVGKRTGYEPGIFCSVDLATTDPAEAIAFYGELFGWEPETVPGGEATTYTMMHLKDDEVCAIYETHADWGENVPSSNWFSSVSVENADATAVRAVELGGVALDEAFEVFKMARVAVIQDPAGAVFAAWQPREHIGARRVNDVGCMAWNELQTHDPEKASEFYSALFGWELERMEEDGKLAYVLIKNNGWMNGGIAPMTEQHGDAPPHWLPYFTTASCDAAAEKMKSLGGTTIVGPWDMDAGKISVVSDPQGAMFALFEGETEE
jgi:predicted enzyme related to lactoylglutathione lyase